MDRFKDHSILYTAERRFTAFFENYVKTTSQPSKSQRIENCYLFANLFENSLAGVHLFS